MKKKLKKIKFNKKVLMLIGVILIAVIIVSLVLGLSKGKKSQKEILTSELEALGIDFYENFYYDQISSDEDERIEFLKKYKDIGIKINLDNLSRFKTDETKKILKKFVNDKTKKECDKTNSMVIIYPKKPYEKDSYSIDVVLDCGYEKEK